MPCEARRWLWLLIMVSIATAASIRDADAQVPSLAHAELEWLPAASIDETDIELPPDSLTVELTTLRVGLGVPLVLRPQRTILINSLSYLRTDAFYSGDEALATEPVDTFHNLRYRLTWLEIFNPRWSSVVTVAPGLASDFDDISGEDFNVQLSAAAIHTFRRGHTLGVGPAFSTRFGKPLVIPLLLYRWSNEGPLRVALTLPVNAQVTYQMTERVRIGARAAVAGDEYRLSEENRASLTLAYSVLMAGGLVQVRTVGKIFFRAFVGSTVLRRYEIFNGDDKLTTFELDNAPIVQMSLAWIPVPD